MPSLPGKFARLMCTAIKREIADAKWRQQTMEKFERGKTIERLMAVQAKMELAERLREKE